jgi:hypothetical protein
MALPVGLVVLMVATLAGISIYSYWVNQRDAGALSREILKALEQRIVGAVETYLEPASRLARLVRDDLQGLGIERIDSDALESLGIAVLNNYPQLVIVSLGGVDGDFMMMLRQPNGAIDTKNIRIEDNSRLVTWTRRNPDGSSKGTEDVSGDNYDPRIRPWYRGAVRAGGLHWSDVYVFFTSQQPGVTASAPLLNEAQELIGVVGVDIELKQLSEFLANLRIGKNGVAAIVDQNGRLVAYPDFERMLQTVDGKLETVDLKTLENAALTRAYNRQIVEGSGSRLLEVDGIPFISASASLKETVFRDWSVVVVVPESDFVGFVKRNTRDVLLLGTTIILITAVLAALLARQGLRADRNAALLLDRQDRLHAQSEAFSSLASKTALLQPGDNRALGELSEIVSRTIRARRVSIWHLENDGQHLHCLDCYDAESDGHTEGTLFERNQLPALFATMDSGEVLVTADTSADTRTAPLHAAYLGPLGCRALILAPALVEGKPLGAIWLELSALTEEWQVEQVSFARAIANMLALRASAISNALEEVAEAFESTTPSSEKPTRQTDAESKALKQRLADQISPALRAPARSQAFESRLRDHLGPALGVHTRLCSDLSVLVLAFENPLALLTTLSGQQTNVAERLVDRLQSEAAELGVSYLRFAGDEFIAAAGFEGDTAAGAAAVAELALATRDICREILTELGTTMSFTMGIDTGPVVSTEFTTDATFHNIWGEAMTAARGMAATGLHGQIQVTESAYTYLRERYVFTVRGSYYLREVGELSTLTLRSRI